METSFSLSKRAWLTCGFVVLSLVLLRVINLDLRPLHNDEGVNHYFLMQMSKLGYYPYSHANYHGPSYFYLSRLIISLFGDDPQVMRFPAVLSGLGSLSTLFFLLPLVRSRLVILALAFTGCSASLVFVSRYAIHESLFLLGGNLLFFGAFCWHRTQRWRYHLLSGVGLGLLVTTKETFIISLFCCFFAFHSLGNIKYTWKILIQQHQKLALGLFVSSLLVLFLFTGGGIWMSGLKEMVLAIPQWIGRNETDTGHFKPFFHYLWMMVGEQGIGPLHVLRLFSPIGVRGLTFGAEWQFLLIIPALLLGYFSFTDDQRSTYRNEFLLLRFSLIWSITAFLVYSGVKYKTPWLIINLSFPLSLLLACTLHLLLDCYPWLSKGLIASGLTTALFLTLIFNFAIPYGGSNPYSYVHTSPGMLHLLKDVSQYAKQENRPLRLQVAVPQYWPLPYYLRKFKGSVAYDTKLNTRENTLRNDILIAPTKGGERQGYISKYYRLSDVQEAKVYYKR